MGSLMFTSSISHQNVTVREARQHPNKYTFRHARTHARTHTHPHVPTHSRTHACGTYIQAFTYTTKQGMQQWTLSIFQFSEICNTKLCTHHNATYSSVMPLSHSVMTQEPSNINWEPFPRPPVNVTSTKEHELFRTHCFKHARIHIM